MPASTSELVAHPEEAGPQPTVWPCVVALAIALALFGIATSLVFTIAGFAGIALGVGGWIVELRREAHRAS